jgi:2-methylfumaryl-CoA hydratase
VHVRTILENEHGSVLCAFERKALVRAGTLAERPQLAHVGRDTPALDSLDRLPAPLRRSHAIAPRGPLPGCAEDFVPGTVFVHDAGKTVGESEHMQLTLLLRNSHPLHFDEVYCKTNSFQKQRVVYGGLVLSWALANTSRDLCGQALWDLGLSDGAHPNPTLGGDTICTVSRVEDVRLDGATADVTLRVVGIKNQSAFAAWTEHGDTLFLPELAKQPGDKLSHKVVEVTRTIRVPRRGVAQ